MGIWLFVFSVLATVAHAEVTEIALGSYHSCALLTDGKVMCWGRNTYGQLGEGTPIRRDTPVEVSYITTATSIALGAITRVPC